MQMQSLVLAGNFRELTNEELYEVNGGLQRDIIVMAAGTAGAGSVALAAVASAKTGATIGAILGPKGALGGVLIGGGATLAVYGLVRGGSALVNWVRQW